MPTLAIDLFSDVVCPWCYIGSAHLDAALAQLASDGITATVAHRPFLLDPTTPPEGAGLVERIRRRYGGEPRAIFSRVEEAGRAAGLALDFTHTTRTYNTIAAHTLLRHAEPRGTQRPLAQALYAAHFRDARNISDPDVLSDIAAPHGFDRDEVRRLATDAAARERTVAEATAAAARGIRGVPFFVFDRRLAVSGAQPVPTLVAAAREALRTSATQEGR